MVANKLLVRAYLETGDAGEGARAARPLQSAERQRSRDRGAAPARIGACERRDGRRIRRLALRQARRRRLRPGRRRRRAAGRSSTSRRGGGRAAARRTPQPAPAAVQEPARQGRGAAPTATASPSAASPRDSRRRYLDGAGGRGAVRLAGGPGLTARAVAGARRRRSRSRRNLPRSRRTEAAIAAPETIFEPPVEAETPWVPAEPAAAAGRPLRRAAGRAGSRRPAWTPAPPEAALTAAERVWSARGVAAASPRRPPAGDRPRRPPSRSPSAAEPRGGGRHGHPGRALPARRDTWARRSGSSSEVLRREPDSRGGRAGLEELARRRDAAVAGEAPGRAAPAVPPPRRR